MTETTKKVRCIATVWKRDGYRYTGRGSSGFSMTERECQCSRAAVPGTVLCAAHAKKAAKRNGYIRTSPFYEFVESEM